MIHLITGGERSGKSSYGQEMAENLTDKPVYLATAKVWDEEMKERVNRHKAERGTKTWETIEEQIRLSAVLPSDRVVLMDCVTLWLTNIFHQCNNEKEKSLEVAKSEFNKIKDYNGTLLVITNEIGMGVHAQTKLGRDFVEVQGWVNQYIASYSDSVTLMVSGLPLKVK
ncbi:bifunctional adenosylcobinamide kinase/adenosylcobinamide-phosphate guanylyltransferase [Fulvivirga sp. M361]|uniref:bifunctional adenosylcobinamide kinase/adenosylcobinamide-phosphate guanylyltransferase n=1 Tax=Fulvivirga sp. M361 TaxID=2594266 RepID=UPI00117BA068|nr:bifunctional adenosylcobinamide kinase/adenosylcobinamide-phosphate guanylyltransferase [Fulvivirga sp. M361]TRX55530.1 bifunctional adenosylcobinamide kinase/adenosylcobinamide-phosphate guanylyltransferase [Fulvivirga sp. M361]